ncbi:hypothetical protein ABEB36_006162 [Hypothenemus hampei]|uniref:Uncharacterized protein n=1 Tax=Hypothenemus hampei TaxID=57062 RepID=A0ABD1F0P2_HYPHA
MYSYKFSGAGTDFKTSARLEGNCGLHVILAFLPCNKRVEDQGLEALGIAVSDNENIEFKEVITRRDKLETMRVNDIADNKITEFRIQKDNYLISFHHYMGILKKNGHFGWRSKHIQQKTLKKLLITGNLGLQKMKTIFVKAVEQEYDKFLKEAKSIINENNIDKSDREKAKSEIEHALKISNSSELLKISESSSKHFLFPLERNCPDYKRHAVEHLEKAAKALTIEHDYLEELIGAEESVLASIIISEKGEQDNNQQTNCTSNTNLFLKHLQTRLVCLAVYKENICKPQIVIGVNDGAIIDCKVPRYLSKLDSHNELKKHITERSVDELEYVGMSSIYQLRKIHDVHKVIAGAQIQIGGAFALLASAAAFPVLLPVNGPLAGAMISEV